MMGRLVCLGVLLATCDEPLVGSTWAGAPPGATTYDAVRAGMSCQQQDLLRTAAVMECNYHVGRSLHFTIAGVGEADATIAFMSSSFEGDYYGSVGFSHGCVVVQKGRAWAAAGDDVSGRIKRWADMAFVSPRDGKIYPTWEARAAARGVER